MNLALFDFDGTITFSDTFTPFLHFAVERKRIATGTLLLSPMILGYKLGLVPSTHMRGAAVRVVFRGRNSADVHELGARYARETLPGVVRPEAMKRIQWHQAQGDLVVVVSASLDAYLQHWCAALGVDVICSELEAIQGTLTGRYAGGDCSGKRKASRVRARYDLSRYRVIYAYGDTREDQELLHLANKRYFRWQELEA